MAAVKVPRKLMQKFVRRAKACFPREYFVFLLGQETQAGWSIHDLCWPLEGEIDQDPEGNYVQASEAYVVRAWNEAKEAGLALIGDIHSHCYTHEEAYFSEPIPSFADWTRWEHKPANHPMKIFAICELRKTEAGRILTRNTFWRAEAPLPIKLK